MRRQPNTIIFYVPNDVAVINGFQSLNGRFKRSVKIKRAIKIIIDDDTIMKEVDERKTYSPATTHFSEANTNPEMPLK
jgi:hypothetical protein